MEEKFTTKNHQGILLGDTNVLCLVVVIHYSIYLLKFVKLYTKNGKLYHM